MIYKVLNHKNDNNKKINIHLVSLDIYMYIFCDFLMEIHFDAEFPILKNFDYSQS